MSSYAGFGLQQWENPETMSRYRKLTTICAAVVLSLGLAACGGGGGSNLADQQQNTVDYAKAVTEARAAAKVSYTAAETDATNAETAADAAEATASGTPDATAARAAATAARTAADAAKAAHDAIEDGKTKAAADAATAQAEKAADEAANANTAYMTAKDKNDAIQTAANTYKELQRKQAIADARSFGGASVTSAKTAADDAQDAADAAKTASDNANAAYMAAVSGRTDATEAKKQADAAAAAHTAAQTAADAAQQAYMDAKAAIDGVTDDSTLEEANSARMTANEEAGKAATSKTTAMTSQSDAESAETKAVAAAGSYSGSSLGLLAAANDADAQTDKARAATITAVAGAIESAAKSTGNRNDSRNSGNGTVSASWLGNTRDNPATDAKETEVTPVLTVTIGGGVGEQDITSDTKGNPDADPVVKPNASMITGLTGFAHGFDITVGDRHAIVFTDKVQGADRKYTVTSKAFGGRALNLSSIKVNTGASLNGTLDDLDGKMTYDHDGDPDTSNVSVTLTCVSAAGSCRVKYEGTKVTSITGTVEVSHAGGTEISAAADPAENSAYLAFGVWLREDSASTTDTDETAFGAIAGGGSPTTSDTYGGAVVTGKATYRGAAAGVYTQGKAVDYFQGDATLTADFGTKPASGDDTALGTITGTIGNIMAGGMATGDVINLNTDATPDNGNISSLGAISGNARMGAATVKGDVVTYPYNGTWSAQFYNGTADDSATTGVNESHAAPGSVAGTFGVTGTDKMGTPDDNKDDVTTSYVGAFGAHKQ